MAQILGRQTNNDVEWLEVDGNPASGAGTPAPQGSFASYEAGGFQYIKTGPADVDWDLVVTAASGSSVGSGQQLRLAVYDLSPTGTHLADSVTQGSGLIDVTIQAQPSRAAALEYRIPDPGVSGQVDFILSQGAQTKAGDMTFSDNVIVGGNLTVNGTMTFLNSVDTDIRDKFIVLNKGGAATSAGGAGVGFEENSLITGYMKIAANRNGFEFLAPNVASKIDLDLSNLTAARVQHFADTAGTFVMRPDGTPGVSGQVAFWSDANNIISNSGLTFSNISNTLTVPNLVISGSLTTGLGAGIVHSSAGGLLSSSPVLLGSEVSGVLPVTSGGTNNSSLSGKQIMVSSSAGTAIVEAGAMTNGQLLIGSTGASPVIAALQGTTNQVNVTNGAGSITLSLPQDIHNGASPTFQGMTLTNFTLGSVIFAGTSGVLSQDNSKFFYDVTNHRLGLGTTAPSRLLDVNGTSLFEGAIRFADASAVGAGSTAANWEAKQAYLQTTNATPATLASIATVSNSEMFVEARVMGRKNATNDSAAYVRTAKIKNVGGVLTLSKLQTDYTAEDVAAWDATLVVSGSNVVVQVTGAASSTIDWVVTYFVQVLQ